MTCESCITGARPAIASDPDIPVVAGEPLLEPVGDEPEHLAACYNPLMVPIR
jgi:hypothetical protein